jgi:hypothetical protein
MSKELRLPLICTLCGFAALFVWLFLAVGRAALASGGDPAADTHVITLIPSLAAALLFAVSIASEVRMLVAADVGRRVLLSLLILLQAMALSFAGFLVLIEVYQ